MSRIHVRIIFVTVSACVLMPLPAVLQPGCTPVPGQAHAKKSQQVSFEDVTESCGLKGIDASMCSWADYDSDGNVDVKIGAILYRNNGDSTFTRVDTGPPGSGLWADFNNDGRQDFLSLDGQGALYVNLDNIKFEPAPFPGNLKPAMPSAAAADANNDGFLDVYITNYETTFGGAVMPDQFYLTAGDGSFMDPVNFSGKWAWCARGADWADFDNDGDQDLYVSNYRLMPNNLWVNDGSARFADEAKARGVYGDATAGMEPATEWYPAYEYTGHTIGSCWGDLNNDGNMDLVVVNFSHPPEFQNRVQVLINSGPPGYTFTDINKNAVAGIYWQESYAKGALGDYDNDGDLDLYITTVYSGDHGDLFRNDGTGIFTPVGDLIKVRTDGSYQVGWADYDNDGDLDLLVRGRLFRNSGNRNSWVKVKVAGGAGSNRSAVGARVRVTAGSLIQIREVSAGNSGNQSPLVQHFGLGSYRGRVKVEVRFPSGKRSVRKTGTHTTLSVTEAE